MKKIDYSSEAITRRLRQTEQLRVLSLSLMKAKELSDQGKKASNLDTDLKPSPAAGDPDKN